MSQEELPDDFSAPTFLYLNPEVVALSNVTTVENARDRYADDFSHLHYVLPGRAGEAKANDNGYGRFPFLADVYIAQRRDDIDVSTLNGYIEDATKKVLRSSSDEQEGSDDENEQEEELGGRYVPNFYRRARLDASNVFVFDDGTDLTDEVEITPCNMRVGDRVKILKDGGASVVYGKVVAIPDEHRFEIGDGKGGLGGAIEHVTDFDASYIVFGIKVRDPERLAHINFTRRYHQGFSNADDQEYVHPGEGDKPPFNPDLYRLLYPDARQLTPGEAFVSFHNKWAANDFRISKASDIPNADTPYFEMNTKTAFAEEIEIKNTVYWKGVALTYGVSTDDERPPDEAPDNASLITESAIKRYVDRARSQIVADRSFDALTVDGSFSAFSNNLTVDEHEVRLGVDLACDSNLICAGDVNCEGRLSCDRALVSDDMYVRGRVGIGGIEGDEEADKIFEDGDDGAPLDQLGVKSLRVVSESGALAFDADPDGIESWIWTTGKKTRPSSEEAYGKSDSRHLFLRHTHSPSDKPLLACIPPPADATDTGVPGQLHVEGDVFVRGSVFNLSDATAKTSILPMQGALNRVRALRGYTYRRALFLDDDKDENRREDAGTKERKRAAGLLAHEVDAVLPEAVEENPLTGELSVCYSGIVSLLVQALNDVSEEVRSLRAVIASSSSMEP